MIPSLGELEMQVLQQVWDLQPCTERQVSDLIRQERDIARTTVLKTLQRLESKGVLERLPGDGPIRFKATLDKKKLLPQLVRQFVNTILGGSPDPLVAYFADSRQLSADDLKQLKTMTSRLTRDKKTNDPST
ncbi:MAG: BlaI/MecI/CopY family transcriptional regulator [Planctomycetaceae bacterium]|nr:BlaI/MecI/CopY family transcriptional regulator [Planctomycetaceae bacterium]